MNIEIEVIKEDVLLQVKTEAFYTGESNKDGDIVTINRATKTQLSDDDDYILETYIDSAATVMADTLTGHLSNATVDQQQEQTEKGTDTTKYVFTLDVPSTYDTNQTPSIKKGIQDYMCAYALYRWYKRVDPKMADASELEKFISDINHRINQRTRPVRRTVLPLNF